MSGRILPRPAAPSVCGTAGAVRGWKEIKGDTAVSFGTSSVKNFENVCPITNVGRPMPTRTRKRRYLNTVTGNRCQAISIQCIDGAAPAEETFMRQLRQVGRRCKDGEVITGNKIGARASTAPGRRCLLPNYLQPSCSDLVVYGR